MQKRVLHEVVTRVRFVKVLGISLAPLYRKCLRIVLFADASLASNADISSQLGFVKELANQNNKADIIPLSSFKSKRFTCSLFLSELYAVVHAFYIVSALRKTIINMFGRSIPMKISVDSKSQYDFMVGIK